MRNCHSPEKSTPAGTSALFGTSSGLDAQALSIRQAIRISEQPLNVFVKIMSTQWEELR
jgi:hypothetical protein